MFKVLFCAGGGDGGNNKSNCDDDEKYCIWNYQKTYLQISCKNNKKLDIPLCTTYIIIYL